MFEIRKILLKGSRFVINWFQLMMIKSWKIIMLILDSPFESILPRRSKPKINMHYLWAPNTYQNRIKTDVFDYHKRNKVYFDVEADHLFMISLFCCQASRELLYHKVLQPSRTHTVCRPSMNCSGNDWNLKFFLILLLLFELVIHICLHWSGCLRFSSQLIWFISNLKNHFSTCYLKLKILCTLLFEWLYNVI